MTTKPNLNNQKLLAHGVRALNQHARKITEQRLKQQPDSGDLWFKLGELCRGMGALKQATEAYQKAMDADYKSQLCRYLINLTGGDDSSLFLDYPEHVEYTPTPFIHTVDFLNKHEMGDIWRLFNQHQGDFKPSVVGPKNQGTINTALRQSVLLAGGKAAKFESVVQTKLMPVLEQAGCRFGVSLPHRHRLVSQVTSHGNGDYYRVHSDHGDTYPRVLSFIYYFSHQPQRFTGGELQLLDSNLANKTYNTNGTLIHPTHNSLIVFPSQYFHQVCPIKSADTERKYGRNSINGWLTALN